MEKQKGHFFSALDFIAFIIVCILSMSYLNGPDYWQTIPVLLGLAYMIFLLIQGYSYTGP